MKLKKSASAEEIDAEICRTIARSAGIGGRAGITFWDRHSDPANPGWVYRLYRQGELVEEIAR